jgi:hypothetical protein
MTLRMPPRVDSAPRWRRIGGDPVPDGQDAAASQGEHRALPLDVGLRSAVRPPHSPAIAPGRGTPPLSARRQHRAERTGPPRGALSTSGRARTGAYARKGPPRSLLGSVQRCTATLCGTVRPRRAAPCQRALRGASGTRTPSQGRGVQTWEQRGRGDALVAG